MAVNPLGNITNGIGSQILQSSSNGTPAGGSQSSPNSSYGITQYNNRPLMIRDSHLASNTFGFQQGGDYCEPKPKFIFYLEFFLGAGLQVQPPINVNKIGMYPKTVTVPNIKIKTEILNQYNKKRIVQTVHDHEELVIRFYDTVDNLVLNMWWQYYKYYYGDPNSTDATNWSNDIASQQFQNPSSGSGWGYQLPSATSSDQAPFFHQIVLHQFYSGLENTWTFVNPIITSFNHDELDATAGAIAQECTIHIAFEGLLQTLQNTISQDLATSIGLDRSGYYQPSGSVPSAVSNATPLSGNSSSTSNQNALLSPFGNNLNGLLSNGTSTNTITPSTYAPSPSAVNGALGTVYTGNLNPSSSAIGLNNFSKNGLLGGIGLSPTGNSGSDAYGSPTNTSSGNTGSRSMGSNTSQNTVSTSSSNLGSNSSGLTGGISFGNSVSPSMKLPYNNNIGGIGGVLNAINSVAPSTQSTLNSAQMGLVNSSSYLGYQLGYNYGYSNTMIPMFARGYKSVTNPSNFNPRSNQSMTWDREGITDPTASSV